MIKYLTADELDTSTYHLDIGTAWIGDEGDAVAFTNDRDEGLTAILEMGRVDLGGRCMVTEDVEQAWMRFHVPDGYQSDEWEGKRCDQDDDAAIRVVVARGVSDCASLAVEA